MRKYTQDEIALLDQSLYQLAIYEASAGMIVLPKYPEQSLEFQVKIADTFNRFKRSIQSGECTYDFIEQAVLHKNGAIKTRNLTVDELLSPEVIEKNKQERQTDKFITGMFGDILSKGNFADEIKSQNSIIESEGKSRELPPPKGRGF